MSVYALVKDGTVYSCIEAEQDIIDLFNQFGWFRADESQVNVTAMKPRPGIGWTYTTIRTPNFRSPAPTDDSVWIDEPPGGGHWGEPPESDPPSDTQPTTAN